MNSSIKKIVIISIWFVLGFFIIAACFWGYINVNIFKTKSKAEAVILENIITSDTASSKSHRSITYSYNINNNTYTKLITTNKSYMSNLEKGDKINIYYDLRDPQKSGILKTNFALLFWGLFCISIGIFAFIFRKKIILKI